MDSNIKISSLFLSVGDFLCSGVALCLCGGCLFSDCFEEPSFEHPEAINYPYRENKEFSSRCSNNGWQALDGWNVDKARGCMTSHEIIHAQDYFNWCWDSDHDNYHAFWGWGIIRGEQAELTSNPAKKEKFLQDSVKYLKQTLSMSSLPAKEHPNLIMDLSNAYNNLGAFYASSGNQELSQKNFEEARSLLKQLLQTNPQNGNLYRILSFNAFHRKDYKDAQLYREKAKALNVFFAPDYIKKLEENNR